MEKKAFFHETKTLKHFSLSMLVFVQVWGEKSRCGRVRCPNSNENERFLCVALLGRHVLNEAE